MRIYKLMDLSIIEKKPATNGTKKETRECYNYGIEKHLARDCRKPKTGPKPQRRK